MIYGACSSRTKITERRSVNSGPSSRPRTEGILGQDSQAEPATLSLGSSLQTRIPEQSLAGPVLLLEQQMGETHGFSKRVGQRGISSVFHSPIPIPEQSLA